MDAIKREAKSDHSNYDCFACAVLTHGECGQFFGVDGEKVLAETFKNAVNGINCKSLVGKPKLFIIQACRGGELLGCQSGMITFYVFFGFLSKSSQENECNLNALFGGLLDRWYSYGVQLTKHNIGTGKMCLDGNLI